MSNAIDLQALAYLMGSVGILVEWQAYRLHCGLAFRRWSGVAALLWGTQYCLLDAWTAGLTMACTALRSLLSGQLASSDFRHWAAAGFSLLFAVLTLLSWQGGLSLLPCFAVINTTLALFYLANRPMRIALLASSIAWIANDIYWQAWPALLAETIAMLINGNTIRKLNSH